ncbi:hypothetical protein H0E87_008191 [Populus deltoides]|uniref:Senescence domain-containing protein n=1 Tax=Populus deltoides TaxID=3696 RepID=A0A8T2YZ47_POPDE|nr:hypothetical protein H0E87_008191 [Populus deltoides]
MSSPKRNSLYPQVILSNPEAISATSSTPSSLYPTTGMKDLAENLFPEDDNNNDLGSPLGSNSEPHEEVLIKISGSIVHLIERDHSVELACGDFFIVSLKQGDTIVAVFARVGDDIQWPLANDEAAVKLDGSHYFFTLWVPGNESDRGELNKGEVELLNYGEVNESGGKWEVVDGSVAEKISPDELEKKKELTEKSSAAYWTVLAPNVEDYSSSIARLIAAGSGQLIKGIFWCGDVTVDRLKWGNEFFKIRIDKSSDSDISPGTLRRIKRVKKLTKMSEGVALGILTGVVKVSGFFTSPIVNSKNCNPTHNTVSSACHFYACADKVCDAVEVAGKNVMSTSSIVTTGLVSHRYGEEAGKATNEGFDAAGHAIGTAWAVFKIRKALNPKSVFKPTTLVKAAARANSTEMKPKNIPIKD